MQTKEQIKSRLKQLLAVELDARCKGRKQKLPHTCTFNHRQPLDVRKQVNGEPNPQYNRVTQPDTKLSVLQTVGLCMYGAENEEWPGNICEDPEDSKLCPYYNPRESVTDVALGLRSNLEDLDWCAKHLPEICTLIWVLEGYTPTLTWWERWYYWLTTKLVKREYTAPNLGKLLCHDPVVSLTNTESQGQRYSAIFRTGCVTRYNLCFHHTWWKVDSSSSV